MFGLTEQEMDSYKIIVQDYAVRDVTPMVVGSAKFITPVIEQEGKESPDTEYVNKLVTDVEIVITLTALHMALDYAYLQSDSNKKEKEIVKSLHVKYETFLINQFIRYGVSFTEEVLSEIIGQILLELPYLYLMAIQDEDFDDDQFLIDKMEAYEEYIESTLLDEDEGEVDEEEE